MRHAIATQDADVRFLLEHQHPGGAYVASPDFSQYPYAWVRDGAFVAHALDAVGERASAERFHAWTAEAVLALEVDVRAQLAARAAGRPVDHARMLPARFRLDGTVEAGDWPDFQVDGYGQWLWSLGTHAAGPLPAGRMRDAAALVATYLAAFWGEPCYDAWEEGRTQQHTSTLASAAAGLRAAVRLLGAEHAAAAETAWAGVRARGVVDGVFVKAFGRRDVDASLVWLATPFALVRDDDPVFRRTLVRIEDELLVDGGLRRYRADTFYGGGAWTLLTAGLAWHHACAGRADRAQSLLAWVDAQRRSDGGLPEQVPVATSDPWFLDWWTRRWGPSAARLLWSHAMVVLARSALG
ncbi:MAG: glycoside hydrolase family 15 protein [Trueperaceae bacterium]|nr:glycoside hydrolase family 15 protein [Trueperaceae bacterium]